MNVSGIPIDIIIVRDDDTGEHRVRLAIPMPDDAESAYTLTMTSEVAVMVGRSIQFAGHACANAGLPPENKEYHA